jgi:hypothetical protein
MTMHPVAACRGRTSGSWVGTGATSPMGRGTRCAACSGSHPSSKGPRTRLWWSKDKMQCVDEMSTTRLGKVQRELLDVALKYPVEWCTLHSGASCTSNGENWWMLPPERRQSIRRALRKLEEHGMVEWEDEDPPRWRSAPQPERPVRPMPPPGPARARKRRPPRKVSS